MLVITHKALHGIGLGHFGDDLSLIMFAYPTKVAFSDPLSKSVSSKEPKRWAFGFAALACWNELF